MIIKKITVGFVVQTFDTVKNEFTHQEFAAGDDVSYEDEYGNSIANSKAKNAYLAFEMKQPKSHKSGVNSKEEKL